MCPRILTIGPVTIYGFGLMMGIAFLVSSLILGIELKRKKLDPALANTITLIALVAGISGSKILFMIENWQEVSRNPADFIFSPSGLTWYGGLFLAILCIILYLRSRKVSIGKVFDAAAPVLALGYGIARLGCHLAGDGDYGIPTTLPWGTNYEHGTLPPSVAFRDVPEIASRYPHGIVPDNTPLHPTPVYEFILGVIIFLILWKIRKRVHPDGHVFAHYLILAGFARFAVEFLRINPPLVWGLSEAQVISVALVGLGFYLLAKTSGRTGTLRPGTANEK